MSTSYNVENPKIIAKQCKESRLGLGLFAATPILRGEAIASFDGKVFRLNSMEEHIPNDPPHFYEDHAVHFEKLAWRDSISLARLANHSCEPNCGIRDLLTITAMRDIKAGEEITWDYAMTEDDGEWSMICLCGTDSCRNIVKGYSYLPHEFRERYKGFISSWLLDPPRPFAGH